MTNIPDRFPTDRQVVLEKQPNFPILSLITRFPLFLESFMADTTSSSSRAKKTARKAPARKAASGAAKAAPRKTTAKKTAGQTKRPDPTETHARKVTVGQLADHIQSLVGQAGRTASAVARESAHTAGVLAGRARDKAQRLTDHGRQFVREHPAEAAGLAAAGLTVLAAALGRKKLGPAVKAAAASGVAVKAGQTFQRLRKRRV